MFWIQSSDEVCKNCLRKNPWGPIPRNTSLDLDSVVAKSIERVLSAFDDAVQVGLVKLRLGEIGQISTGAV